MTSIPLYHLTWYLTNVEGISWRKQDYDARAIVRIVKGESFNGELRVRVGGEPRTFDERNGGQFLPVLARRMARELAASIDGPFAMVPIPNSDAVAGSTKPFPTLTFAEDVASHIGARATVAPALRWTRRKSKAHKESGSRNPDIHYAMLRASGVPQGRIVLFDDVKTTGSQLIAAYRRLRDEGAAPIAACVIGHATRDQLDKMLGWSRTELLVDEDDPFDF